MMSSTGKIITRCMSSGGKLSCAVGSYAALNLGLRPDGVGKVLGKGTVFV